MPTDKQTIIDAAGAERDRKCDLAWEEYDRATASMRAEYNLAIESYKEAHDRACDAAWDEYDRAIGSKE